MTNLKGKFIKFFKNRYSVYLTPTNNTSCLQIKQRTEKASGKHKTSINNLESEKQANCEEFISFSRRKRSWKEKTKRLRKIPERHSVLCREQPETEPGLCPPQPVTQDSFHLDDQGENHYLLILSFSLVFLLK